MKTACVISSYAYINENINYGALLQYYALERALEKCGIEAYWLRFCDPETKELKYRIKKFIKRVLDLSSSKEFDKCLLNFRVFLNKYCRLSKNVYWSNDEIHKNLPEADYYITGSDQVWGSTVQENYLCFVPDDLPKISYAASFGKDIISKKHKEVIGPWLKRFDAISVREESGVKICNNLGVNAQVTLDPTLLIDSEEYPTVPIDKSPDIFCYFLNFRDKEDDLYWGRINRFSNLKGYSIEVACTNQTYSLFENKYRLLPSPEVWLSKYANAKYIITNTFHGTVFAIIYHKNFLVLKQRGEGAKQNGRIESLLNMVNLRNRYFDDRHDIDEQLNKPINWGQVDAIICDRKEASFSFLRNALD